MREIELTQGKVAFIDDEDFERVNQFKWYANRSGRTYYAIHNVTSGFRQQTSIKLHRYILEIDDSHIEVDHINGNGLDNRKCNLRVSNHMDNSRNRRKNINNTSGYRGVTWDKRASKWVAQIRVNWKIIHIGNYDDPIEAAKAYDQYAKMHFGPFARTNF